MEQAFNDLYNEKRQSERGTLGFVFWIFFDTGIGIVREHALQIMEGNAMKNMFITLRSPAILSFILVFPFLIMELANRQNSMEAFPLPLFVMLWLLPMVFIVILMPVLRNVRMGNSLMAHRVQLLIRVGILVLIAVFWTGILMDQMSCFLGVPNCD